MAQTHFHRLLRAKVMEVLDTSSKNIASGVCKNYEHYRYETGIIKGLEAALEIANDLEKDLDQ